MTSELICDELGVAYPVVKGIPNLRPADGRIIETGDNEISSNQQAWAKPSQIRAPAVHRVESVNQLCALIMRARME